MPKRETKPLPPVAQLRELLEYEPETGVLRWRYRKGTRATWNTRFAGKPAGKAEKHGHIRLQICNTSYFAHRVIWKMVYGREPPHEIDHRDQDPSNNRIENLRAATSRQNMQNRKGWGKERLKGVSRAGKRFRAVAGDGKGGAKHLGMFDTPEQAHAAYCRYAAERHKEFFCASSA